MANYEIGAAYLVKEELVCYVSFDKLNRRITIQPGEIVILVSEDHYGIVEDHLWWMTFLGSQGFFLVTRNKFIRNIEFLRWQALNET